MLKKSLIEKIFSIHWPLMFLMLALVSMGFAMLYSAADGNFYPWAASQMKRFVVLFPIMLLVAIIDIKYWYKLSYVIYGACLILLILIFIEPFSVTAMGATRWVRLGPVTIQPSELMKICVIFALARYFNDTSINNVHRMVYLIPPLLMSLLPFALIVLQPDLGTSLILLMVCGAIFFMAGVKIWKFIAVGVLGLASLPVVWSFMHDYQKKRVTSFLDPEKDALGSGYNIIQSKIAIGSGGFDGKGFLDGSQSQLSFLPEKQTDFIFTMLAEEFGFMGGSLTIILFGLVMLFGIIIAVNAASQFGRIMAIGIITVFSLHVFINIGMVTGMIPVVGAPLPFLSYGGTILSTMMLAFGLLFNVHIHRDEKFGYKGVDR